LQWKITSDNGKYKLAGENGDDFPKMPTEQNASEVTIPASVLSNAVSKALFAVSSDELRPAMTGMLWQFNE
jgi:DNA polymerase-3 subunit beta